MLENLSRSEKIYNRPLGVEIFEIGWVTAELGQIYSKIDDFTEHYLVMKIGRLKLKCS